MSFLKSEAEAAVVGTLMVVGVSIFIYVISVINPAKPTIYLLAWAFVAIPLVLVLTGWLAAEAAYYACLHHNRAIASAVLVTIISAIAGIGLWYFIALAIGVPEDMRLFSASLYKYGPAELGAFLIMYALNGAIGGIFHYFMLHGRECEVKKS